MEFGPVDEIEFHETEDKHTVRAAAARLADYGHGLANGPEVAPSVDTTADEPATKDGGTIDADESDGGALGEDTGGGPFNIEEGILLDPAVLYNTDF